MTGDILAYFSEHGTEYLGLLGTHIAISAVSVILAMLLGIPLGVLCAKYRLLKGVSESAFGLLRIVPSLAVLLLLIPVMGTGIRPAVIALVILAVPPILLNTITAFLNLPASVLEAAEAMGMSHVSRFFCIKLPLAFPLIFAGIRTAAIEVIASATIASYIGAGGLGDIIVTGLALLRTDLLVIGGGSAALLSLTVGALLDLWYRSMTKYLQ